MIISYVYNCNLNHVAPQKKEKGPKKTHTNYCRNAAAAPNLRSGGPQFVCLNRLAHSAPPLPPLFRCLA